MERMPRFRRAWTVSVENNQRSRNILFSQLLHVPNAVRKYGAKNGSVIRSYIWNGGSTSRYADQSYIKSLFLKQSLGVNQDGSSFRLVV